MLKNCTKCGTMTEFKEDHNNRQGYWCKSCRSKASVESARKHRDVKRRNNNAYYSRISGSRSEKTARWRANNPDRKAAQQAVQTAVRNRSLIKKPCEVCGDNKRIHAHHDDYSKRLIVSWLCHTHHMDRHYMLKVMGK